MQRKLLLVAFVIVAVLVLTGTLFAGSNKYGVARRQIALSQAAWVGDVLVPAGNSEVRHRMDGTEHVMLFHQMNSRHPEEARVKCSLMSVARPIEQTRSASGKTLKAN
jgi:hypothetical protein